HPLRFPGGCVESLEQVAREGQCRPGQSARGRMGHVFERHLPALVMRKMRAIAMQLKSTNILSPIILVAISLAGCSAEAPAGVDPRPQQVAPATSAVADASVGEVNCEDAKPPALNGIMGRYQVRSADKYRGGLTTAEHATARIGSGATITTDHFRI